MSEEREESSFHLNQKINHDHIFKPKKFYNNIVVFGLLNLVWFLFRTGRKPSRIIYPCQQEALKNISLSLGALIPILTLPLYWKKIKPYSKPIFAIALVISPICGAYAFHSLTTFEEVQLQLEPLESTSDMASDIFVVNGKNISHVSNLIDLMGTKNVSFYLSSNSSINQGPDGLISKSDVVLLKVNAQWSARGGTNTDFLKELIQAIVDHPDGFEGELIVADNGQGSGDLDRAYSNAEDHGQSTQDVVNMFSASYNISTFLWDDIRRDEVQEYSDGDMDDGYIVYDTQDLETKVYVSYPKFETLFGTKVSFKNGIWNGSHYEDNLKVINLPVLKSHSGYGVTATLKNYMGVQTESLANGHSTIAYGAMATLMIECGLPTLNIIDAIWINANPETSTSEGPSTSYTEATRVDMLIAGFDPVAMDYWSAKHVLMETAELTGHSNIYSLDPDGTKSTGLTEAYGIWLNESKFEFERNDYNFTSDENMMNVYIISENPEIETLDGRKIWLWIGTFSSSAVAIVLALYIFKRKKIFFK